jgi:adenosylhomocysteine nucleosidase
VVVLSALREELAPLARHLRIEARQRIATLHVLWGELDDRPVILATGGEGAERARGALAILDQLAPGAPLVLLGVAGALSPGLRVGELVVGARALALDVAPGQAIELPGPPVETAAAGLPAVQRATLVSVDRVVTSLEEKAELWRRAGTPRPATVDMESAFVAGDALRSGRRCLFVRAVSDDANEPLPAYLARCRRADGALDRRRVAVSALLEPHSIPSLLRLQRRVRLGSLALAEFVRSWLRSVPQDAR